MKTKLWELNKKKKNQNTFRTYFSRIVFFLCFLFNFIKAHLSYVSQIYQIRLNMNLLSSNSISKMIKTIIKISS